jgi:DNA-binding transcriptional LysR family regulator
LIALRTVADFRNFRAAAKHLGRSPSAISQTIKLLEGRLGAPLLSRTTRSTRLTEAGERFLSQVGPALDQILSAPQEINALAKRPSGLLRITMPKSVYLRTSRVIAAFQKAHREISLEIDFGDDVGDLVERGFDAGIQLSETLAKDVIAVKLIGPVRFVTAASPRYLKEAGRPMHPRDLLIHNCLRFRTGRDEFYDHWEFESKGKDFSVKVTGTLVMNDAILLRDAALAGSGIIYFSEDLVRDQVNAGKLEVVLGQYAATSAGYYLYFPKRSQVQPKLRAFVDFMTLSAKRAAAPAKRKSLINCGDSRLPDRRHLRSR